MLCMDVSLREQLIAFFSSPMLAAVIFSWFCAQFIKTLIHLFARKIHSIQELVELLVWRTGGMPSSHSSLVACICTMVAFRSGFSSDVFILALCFYLVTVRDAVGVRRANGIQAKMLNEMGRALEQKGLYEFKKIKEVQGHTPLEVFVGSLLGFFIGVAFSVL